MRNHIQDAIMRHLDVTGLLTAVEAFERNGHKHMTAVSQPGNPSLSAFTLPLDQRIWLRQECSLLCG
jgi:hypothetical protein